MAPAVIYLEPIAANFAFGQINVVLMTLVIADCVPRRTPWPRGLLLGVAIALKLTPAVFLLYFVLRRDGRAALTAFGSFVAAGAGRVRAGLARLVEYWTTTVRHTDRIGSAALNTNQNIAGALARLGPGPEHPLRAVGAACFAVLALTIWAVRRVLRAGEPTLALMCVALFGSGGLAGVLVTPLGVGAADGHRGDGGAGLPAPQHRAGRRHARPGWR